MNILVADNAFFEPAQSTSSINRANFLVVPKLLGKGAEQSLADSGGNFLPIELVMTGKRFNLLDATITPCDGIVQTLHELSARGLTGGRNQAGFLSEMVVGYQNASRRIDALNPIDPLALYAKTRHKGIFIAAALSSTGKQLSRLSAAILRARTRLISKKPVGFPVSSSARAAKPGRQKKKNGYRFLPNMVPCVSGIATSIVTANYVGSMLRMADKQGGK